LKITPTAIASTAAPISTAASAKTVPRDVASGISGTGLAETTQACAPWILVMIVFLLLITYVPIISLWLPNLLMGAAG
jgi:hypothetical protein